MIPLIDKQLEKTIPALYDQDGLENKIAYARFYHSANWEWYVLEYSKHQRLCFGLVDGFEKEYGYFTLDELESIGVQRDLGFIPTNIKELS